MNGECVYQLIDTDDASVHVKPPLSTKKRARSVAWRDTAPEQFEYFPFEACLEPMHSVDAIYEELTFSGLSGFVAVFTQLEWQTLSACIRCAVRSHALYPVVVKGDLSQSKKCAQAATRRLEVILAWHRDLYLQYASTPETADRIVTRQVNYGKSRQRGRAPRKTETACVSCPIAPPRDLHALLLTHDCSLPMAVGMGLTRTVRIYDITGSCVWLVPMSTLVSIGICTPPEPASVEVVPESTVDTHGALTDTIETDSGISTYDVFACL